MAVLARDGGSQKVTFHKLPALAASPLTAMPPGRDVAMPEAVYSVSFQNQVRKATQLRCSRSTVFAS